MHLYTAFCNFRLISLKVDVEGGIDKGGNAVCRYDYGDLLGSNETKWLMNVDL